MPACLSRLSVSSRTQTQSTDITVPLGDCEAMRGFPTCLVSVLGELVNEPREKGGMDRASGDQRPHPTYPSRRRPSVLSGPCCYPARFPFPFLPVHCIALHAHPFLSSRLLSSPGVVSYWRCTTSAPQHRVACWTPPAPPLPPPPVRSGGARHDDAGERSREGGRLRGRGLS